MYFIKATHPPYFCPFNVRIYPEDEHWLFINNNGEIISYGFLRGWHNKWDDICLGLVVNPEYRGRGYGKETCRFLIEMAKTRGLKRIRLHVWPGNKPALRIYCCLGFKFSGRIRSNGEIIGYKEL